MLNNVPSDRETSEIKELLEKNIKLTKEIHEIALYVKKYIFWSRIFGVFKLLIILIPIILSIIYLPPLLGQVLEQYKTILNVGSSINNAPMEISSDFLKFLK